jgi:hypothetical protein
MYPGAQSKATNVSESVQFQAEDSQIISGESRLVKMAEKQPSGKSRKGFHKSPRIMSPTTVFRAPEKTPEEEIAEF